MDETAHPQYGRCPCSGVYESRHVEVRMTPNHRDALVVTDVPQGACPVCGSRVYKAAVLCDIERLMRDASAVSS